jgi:ribosomal protein S18 acetylase RimI-like enzyme
VDGFIGSGEIERFIVENVDRTSVIVVDELVVGYAATEGNMITLLMIDTDFHKQSYGSALLEHVENELFQTYAELTLESFEHNDVANRFYQKHGWSEERKFVNEEYQIDMVTLKKTRPNTKGKP